MKGAPPWWPEGEQWPPRGPPWRRAPARFRRRFLFVALAGIATLVVVGIAIGLAIGGPPRSGPPWTGGGPGGPKMLLGVAAFVAVVGGIATVLAYRRVSRPVSRLLAGAERVAAGDYQARVEPGGPRELQSLIDTFNAMTASLADNDEQRRRLLADVTHELRTPLAVLQSGLEAQLDGIHERDDRHLSSLLEETQRLGRLVDDLHTLALADAGQLRLRRSRTAPAALAAEVVDGYQAMAARKGVRLAARVDGGAPDLEVDPARLHQVLSNLVSNALRHTPADGEVSVEVTAGVTADGRDTVAFAVADTGPGIAEDALPGVFDRFARAADSHGSGLGLSIARDLVEAHGGTITAENRPEGGLVVLVTLNSPYGG
ncbi:MAG: sensor histidine kinase [Acidimicrobiales bacterium]